MKQFKLNVLWQRLSKIYWNKGNDSCFTDCVKDLNVGMHLDVYEWIWFKLGMMIDTIVLYILILIKLTLPLIQGHKSPRKRNILCQ